MKEQIILNVTSFLITYIIMFLIYVLVINRKRKNYVEGKKQMEISYLVNKFNLDMRKIKYKRVLWITTFLNPLLIAITFILVINIESLVIGLILGFVVMMILVYSSYEILGRILKKKGERKNV